MEDNTIITHYCFISSLPMSMSVAAVGESQRPAPPLRGINLTPSLHLPQVLLTPLALALALVRPGTLHTDNLSVLSYKCEIN